MKKIGVFVIYIMLTSQVSVTSYFIIDPIIGSSFIPKSLFIGQTGQLVMFKSEISFGDYSNPFSFEIYNINSEWSEPSQTKDQSIVAIRSVDHDNQTDIYRLSQNDRELESTKLSRISVISNHEDQDTISFSDVLTFNDFNQHYGSDLLKDSKLLKIHSFYIHPVSQDLSILWSTTNLLQDTQKLILSSITQSNILLRTVVIDMEDQPDENYDIFYQKNENLYFIYSMNRSNYLKVYENIDQYQSKDWLVKKVDNDNIVNKFSIKNYELYLSDLNESENSFSLYIQDLITSNQNSLNSSLTIYDEDITNMLKNKHTIKFHIEKNLEKVTLTVGIANSSMLLFASITVTNGDLQLLKLHKYNNTNSYIISDDLISGDNVESLNFDVKNGNLLISWHDIVSKPGYKSGYYEIFLLEFDINNGWSDIKILTNYENMNKINNSGIPNLTFATTFIAIICILIIKRNKRVRF